MVGAVVLHYRRWPEVDATLRALRAALPPDAPVVLVDNASGDGSLERIVAEHPDLDVLALRRNLGYGAGMNVGALRLLETGVDSVLLLTHETTLAHDAVSLLEVALTADERVGAVGPLLVRSSAPDRVFSAGGWFDRRTGRVGHVVEPSDASAWDGEPARRVDWLDGAAILVRAAAFRDAGGFDERFFLYFEDNAFSYALAEAGWEVRCVPNARAAQESAGPERNFPALWARNQLLVLEGRVPRRVLVRRALRLLTGAVSSPVRGRSVGEGWQRVRGVVAYVGRRWGALS